METKIPPPLTTLLFGLVMWIVDGQISFGHMEFPGGSLFAYAAILVGIAIMIAANVSFRKAKTTVNPLSPDKASTLVDNGIFSRTRNPMYLGMLLILVGWFIGLGNIVNVIFLPAFVWYMTKFQIMPEEKALTGVFGSPYEDYLKRVRRWI